MRPSSTSTTCSTFVFEMGTTRGRLVPSRSESDKRETPVGPGLELNPAPVRLVERDDGLFHRPLRVAEHARDPGSARSAEDHPQGPAGLQRHRRRCKERPREPVHRNDVHLLPRRQRFEREASRPVAARRSEDGAVHDKAREDEHAGKGSTRAPAHLAFDARAARQPRDGRAFLVVREERGDGEAVARRGDAQSPEVQRCGVPPGLDRVVPRRPRRTCHERHRQRPTVHLVDGLEPRVGDGALGLGVEHADHGPPRGGKRDRAEVHRLVMAQHDPRALLVRTRAADLERRAPVRQVGNGIRLLAQRPQPEASVGADARLRIRLQIVRHDLS